MKREPGKLRLEDLPPELASQVLKENRVRKERKPKEFTKERQRSWALRILGQMASLNSKQRELVLKQALRANEV